MIGPPLQSIFTQTGPGNFEPFFSLHTHTTCALNLDSSTQTQTRLFYTHTAHAPATALRKPQTWHLGSGVRHASECAGATWPHSV
jgi:hypothetical protein